MEILMPCADTGVEECTLVRWLVSEGDSIEPGVEVAVIQVPENRRFDVRLYERGRVGKLLVVEGRTVPVGASILDLVPARRERQGAKPQVRLLERYMSEPVVRDESSGNP